MPETVAHYSFIPWLRQGLNSRIIETDTLGNSKGSALTRAQLNVTLNLKAQAVESGTDSVIPVSKIINIVGPGDVVNLSDTVIIRTNPPANVNNYETNNLVFIEFYEEDFLWRFTPAIADLSNNDNAKKLRPWLALIVLKDDEYSEQNTAGKLACITIKTEAFDKVFPNPAESYAWAHVQVNEVIAPSDKNDIKVEVANQIKADANSALCRLLCPRKLVKSTVYTAFLIPAFETGRRAGLGLDISQVPAQEPSWDKAAQASKDQSLDFPVYYQWSFKTGYDGDFESLVKKLTTFHYDTTSACMPVDVQNLGYGLNQLHRKSIGLEAALQPIGYEYSREQFPKTPDETVFKTQLTNILSLSPNLGMPNNLGNETFNNPFSNEKLSDDPVVVPPVYGVWHCLAQNLNPTNNPSWFEELNLDIRNRAVAGLGTKIVQDKQEDLVNRAWQQVENITSANQKIKEAELTKLINDAVFKKHLKSATESKGLMVTSPMQYLVKQAGSDSVNKQIDDSKIPNASLSAAFLKTIRPLAKNKSFSLQKDIIGNFNTQENDARNITTAILKKSPESAISMVDVIQKVDNAFNAYSAQPANVSKDIFFALLKNIVSKDTISIKNELLATLSAKVDLQPDVKILITDLINSISNSNIDDDNISVTISVSVYETQFDKYSDGKVYNNLMILKSGVNKSDSDMKLTKVTTQGDIASFKDKLSLLDGQISSMASVTSKPIVGDLNGLYQNLVGELKPGKNIIKRISGSIKVWDGSQYTAIKKLKPAMAYPEFTEPVYLYLKKVSQNFILPNIEKIPENSVALLEPNQRFIESFMAGLNYEMAKELFWREYPTDQRGTYFRQFWDINDNLFEQNPENMKDIIPMDQWDKALGQHKKNIDNMVVLVVRGELLSKYPGTMIYAQKAQYNSANPSGPRLFIPDISEATTKFPLFKAELQPDITLIGFNLTPEDAIGVRVLDGETTTGKDPGWFIVFKERAGQVRFGLDDFDGPDDTLPASMPVTWSDLTWEHLVNQKSDLENFQINFSKPLNIIDTVSTAEKYYNEVPRWGSNSAEIASILYQDPVIFARHSSEFINPL
jgi:hypothetical protein